MSKEAAYWEGYNAYLNGAKVEDNPYSTDVEEEEFHEQWKDGYYDAGWDD